MLTVYDGRFNYNSANKRAFPVSDFHGRFIIGNKEDWDKIVDLLKKYTGQQVDLVIDYEASLFGKVEDDADDDTPLGANVEHMRLGLQTSKSAKELRLLINEYDVHVRLAYHVPDYIRHFRISDIMRFVSDFYFTTARNRFAPVGCQWPVPEELPENNSSIIAAAMPGGWLVKAGVQPNLEGTALERVLQDTAVTPAAVNDMIPNLAFRSRKGQLRGTVSNRHIRPSSGVDGNPHIAEQQMREFMTINLQESAFIIQHIETTADHIYLGVIPSGPDADVFKRLMAEDNGDYYFGARYLTSTDEGGKVVLQDIITWDLCCNPRKG